MCCGHGLHNSMLSQQRRGPGEGKQTSQEKEQRNGMTNPEGEPKTATDRTGRQRDGGSLTALSSPFCSGAPGGLRYLVDRNKHQPFSPWPTQHAPHMHTLSEREPRSDHLRKQILGLNCGIKSSLPAQGTCFLMRSSRAL